MTKNEELAYLAGIFDGEGCIQLSRNANGRSRFPVGNVSLKIQVCNNDKRLLEVFTEAGFAGKVQKRTIKKGYKQSYYWICNGKNAAELLHSLLPYLVSKKSQAEAVLLFAETLHPAWKEPCRSSNGQPPQLTKEAVYLRKIAFHAFRREIEKFGGRGLSWAI